MNSMLSLTLRAQACALLMLATPGWAVSLNWTGGAGTPLWSAGANWNASHAPVDGDGVVFGALVGGLTTVDLTVSLDTLSFAAGAGLYPVHVGGDGAYSLGFSGLGIQNLTRSPGPFRQALFADAGSTGGSIVFAGASGINLGTGGDFRPVDLLALGGTLAGQAGGRIVFQDQSSTGLATFNALRAVGAGVAGAAAGQLEFRGSAVAERFTTLTMAGGTAAGATGGLGSFGDSSRIEGIVNMLGGGPGGGGGGRAVFTGAAVAALTSTINNQGGWAGAGSEGATEFSASARLAGGAINEPGNEAGGRGGRLEFRGQSAWDSSGYDGSLGNLQISNRGGSVTGAGGGSVVFREDSQVRGGFLVIVNATDAESTAPDTLGGTTQFVDRSRAGDLTLYNDPGRGAGAIGRTRFENTSSASDALIVQRGGTAAQTYGGTVTFIDNATAANARIQNDGGRAQGAGGGQASFGNAASAGSATVVNAAGGIDGASGGTTRFDGQAGAGSAFIVNQTSTSVGGGGRGSTLFTGASSAQDARIDNEGGLTPISAFTTFAQSATAGSARITLFGGRASGAGGGSTDFIDVATAGTATFVAAAGGTAGALGGRVSFFSSSHAGSAALDLRGASVIGAEGGNVYFYNSASAGTARFLVAGSLVDDPGGPEGAMVTFTANSTAASAAFVVGGNTAGLGGWGRVRFQEAATAADASFTTVAGYSAGGRISFEGTAIRTASAGNARITNGSRATPSGSNGDFGGATIFLAHSTADHAVIVNQAGRTAFGAQTAFRVDATAADASITNAGGAAGELGGITTFVETSSAGRAVIVNRAGAAGAAGLTYFDNAATAAQSTLVAEGGVAGGSGGRIQFASQSTGGTARIVLGAGASAGAGGTLDISAVTSTLAVGSLEGGGQVSLGARSLIVVGPAATTFSGVISGSTPPVFPSLTVQGNLTLTGANVYAGRTVIGDGVNAHSGKLVAANAVGSATGSGEVRVQRGGTLAGSGFIAGPVTLLAGGTIAPGDPVTLTLSDSLTWDGGGVIRLVLGADTAGSDQLHGGTLARGATGGAFVLDLVNAGITLGAAYELLSFDTISGFAPTDFQTPGYEGVFAFDNGTLAFTPTALLAVPEAPTSALLLLGLLAYGCGRRFTKAPKRAGT